MKRFLPFSKAVIHRGLLGKILLCAASLLMAVSLQAQTRAYKITGSVKDAKGAQRGVTVRIDRTSFGGVSDPQGNYTVSANLAPGKYTVVVAAINYKQFRRQITLGDDNSVSLDVKLEEDITRMDEVVVTGTSAASSRKTLGNSIGAVNAKDVQLTGANAIDAAMAGKVAGVQIQQNSGNPAGGVSVRLRGTNTFSGSADPLYIVDGVLINNDSREVLDLGGYAQNRLVDINPNDIERIEVLKGAAAAAIYGARANNGVVQIFTKRGAIGAPTVTFSTRVNTDDLRQKIAWNQEPLRRLVRAGRPDSVVAVNDDGTPVQRYDLQDLIFRRAWGVDNHISVAGGSQGTKYFLSANQTANEGIVRGSSFNRAGARVRVEQVLSDNLTASLGVNYTNSSSREVPNGGLNEPYGALTGFIFAQNNIDPRPRDGVYPQLSPPAVVTRTNPLEAIDRFDFTNTTSRFIGDFQLNYTPIQGLNVNYTFGFDTYSQLGSALIPRNTTTPGYPGGLGRRGIYNVGQVNNDVNIVYTADLSENIKTTTQLGGTMQYERRELVRVQSEQLSPVTSVASSGAIGQNLLDSREELALYGAFLQESIDINGTFFLIGAIRMDASSVFGPENRFQFFPKVSGSALISEFWKESELGKIIPVAKLRGAWGQSGGLTAIGPYTRFTNYAPVNYSGIPGLIVPTQLGSTAVRPERQTELEIGADVAFLENRIGIEFSYYDKVTNDLLLNRTLAPSTGFTNFLTNVGVLTSRGIELLVRAVPVETEDFKWTITGIYNQNRSVISGVEGGFLQITDGFGQVAVVNGQQLGVFRTFYGARNPDGSYLLTPDSLRNAAGVATGLNPARGLPQRERGILNPDGTVTPQRDANGQPSGIQLQKVVGDPNPDFTLSFINEFVIGKLSLRVQIDGMYGQDVFNFTRRVGVSQNYGGLAEYGVELRDNFPTRRQGGLPLGWNQALFGLLGDFVEDGSFTRLREVAISYEITPENFLNIRSARLTLAGRNLFLLTRYSGWDPEVNTGGQRTAVRGFDFVEVPLPRSFSFGLQLTF
ncbi:MAG: SusC/RagA family TonB-linked outer membrane protein [Candidatus Kapabacteria bacterium]|jgi:TonB-linked SusC/RagA family outer membrane protein|nr:SusC/RagA family TonB-linked outer membrane protein [Candidatus Kapabacteria bacterium]